MNAIDIYLNKQPQQEYNSNIEWPGIIEVARGKYTCPECNLSKKTFYHIGDGNFICGSCRIKKNQPIRSITW